MENLAITFYHNNQPIEVLFNIDREQVEQELQSTLEKNPPLLFIEDYEFLYLEFGDTNCDITFDLQTKEQLMSDGDFLDSVKLEKLEFLVMEEVA